MSFHILYLAVLLFAKKGEGRGPEGRQAGHGSKVRGHPFTPSKAREEEKKEAVVVLAGCGRHPFPFRANAGRHALGHACCNPGPTAKMLPCNAQRSLPKCGTTRSKAGVLCLSFWCWFPGPNEWVPEETVRVSITAGT